MSRAHATHWKAGPESPRLPFCHACSRRFHGRVFARLRLDDSRFVEVHKDCVRLYPDAEVVFRSTTVRV